MEVTTRVTRSVALARTTKASTLNRNVKAAITTTAVPSNKVPANEGRKRKVLGNIANSLPVNQQIHLKPNAKVITGSKIPIKAAEKLGRPVQRTASTALRRQNSIVGVAFSKVPQKAPPKIVAKVAPFVQQGHVEVPRSESPEPMDIGEPEPDARGHPVVPAEAECFDPYTYDEFSPAVFDYLRCSEADYEIRDNFLEHQSEVNYKMREVLVDWLNEVHLRYELVPETFYITVALIDMYLQARNVPKRKFQLLGVTAMLLASKYEEIHPPEIDNFVYITEHYCSRKQILAMELDLLKTMNFRISRPLPITFLRRITKAAEVSDLRHTMSKYFLELSLLNHKLCYLRPSLLAAAACYLSFSLISKIPWSEDLVKLSGYKESELQGVAKKLVKKVRVAGKSEANGIYYKYSKENYFSVAAHPDILKCCFI